MSSVGQAIKAMAAQTGRVSDQSTGDRETKVARGDSDWSAVVDTDATLISNHLPFWQ